MAVYQNPVNETANVTFELKESLNTTVEISNTWGEKVYAQNLGALAPGSQMIELDLSQFDNGMCFISLSGEGNTSSKPIRVTKY